MKKLCLLFICYILKICILLFQSFINALPLTKLKERQCHVPMGWNLEALVRLNVNVQSLKNWLVNQTCVAVSSVKLALLLVSAVSQNNDCLSNACIIRTVFCCFLRKNKSGGFTLLNCCVSCRNVNNENSCTEV